MKAYHVIVNPNSGNGKGLPVQKKVQEYLESRGIAAHFYFTEKAGDAREMAKNLVPETVKVLGMIGGDGTYNEVLNGMTPGAYPLAVIPAGTGNDFCRMLAIDSWKKATETMIEGTCRMVDYGEVNQHRFLNVYSTGLDAAIANQANQWKDRYPGAFLYTAALIRQIRRMKRYSYEVIWDHGTYKGEGILVAIGNGAYYGGGMKISPRASLFDGKLDVCLLKPLSPWKLLLLFPTVFMGKHLSFQEIIYVQTKQVRLKVQEEVCAMNMDGEIYEAVQLDVSLVTGKLALMIPKD